MRVLLIMPDARMHKFRVGGRLWSMREAPLTLTTLAGLTADQPDVEYQLADGSMETIPMDVAVDLVGISVITGNAPRAYALADHFRGRGIPAPASGKFPPGDEIVELEVVAPKATTEEQKEAYRKLKEAFEA